MQLLESDWDPHCFSGAIRRGKGSDCAAMRMQCVCAEKPHFTSQHTTCVLGGYFLGPPYLLTQVGTCRREDAAEQVMVISTLSYHAVQMTARCIKTRHDGRQPRTSCAPSLSISLFLPCYFDSLHSFSLLPMHVLYGYPSSGKPTGSQQALFVTRRRSRTSVSRTFRICCTQPPCA